MRHRAVSQPPLRRNRGRAGCDSENLFPFLLRKKIERKPRAASFAFQIMDGEAGLVCLRNDLFFIMRGIGALYELCAPSTTPHFDSKCFTALLAHIQLRKH